MWSPHWRKYAHNPKDEIWNLGFWGSWEMVPGTWEPEVENALNLGVLSGNWELRGGSLIVWENSQSFMWENARSFMWENTQIKPVYPSKASTTVVCELFGAFELSGGKNEIVAIILRLTPDRHFRHKTSDETYLGHFPSFKYGSHHNWRWRPDCFPHIVGMFHFFKVLLQAADGFHSRHVCRPLPLHWELKPYHLSLV